MKITNNRSVAGKPADTNSCDTYWHLRPARSLKCNTYSLWLAVLILVIIPFDRVGTWNQSSRFRFHSFLSSVPMTDQPSVSGIRKRIDFVSGDRSIDAGAFDVLSGCVTLLGLVCVGTRAYHQNKATMPQHTFSKWYWFDILHALLI